MPWRGSGDVYAVWVSEVMLQQTTVAAVVPYFERWMRLFPDVRRLAESAEQDVLAAWQGLGYYRRARNLRAGARLIVEHGWPRGYRDWLEVPGVGKYTAGAIASIALGERVPAVDGNVARVHARLFAGEGCVSSWAQALADCPRPGDVNQALMDLGATVCRPASPECGACPLRSQCRAHQQGTQHQHPQPRSRVRTVELRQYYCVPVCEEQFGVKKFGAGDWWEGLFGFPALDGPVQGRELGTVRMTVTRHQVTATAYLDRRPARTRGLLWATESELGSLPMPAPHRRILALAVSSVAPHPQVCR
jgi:A/G-specific adenine glycosylase